MRKSIISIFLLVDLLAGSACFYNRNAIAETDNNLPVKENINAALPTDNANISRKQDKPLKLLSIQSNLPFAWVGDISAENIEKAKANGNVWNNGELDSNRKYNQIGTAIEVDIMNCAGFLISGKLNKEEDYGWILETMPETAAKDALNKIKQCDSESDSQYPGSTAFAVAPRDSQRRNIKIGEVDTRRLFASLPEKEKKWLNKKLNLPEEYQRVEKENLTLREDGWTDINGDGEIDLLMLSTVCRADDSEGDKCVEILMRVKGKWIEIGSNSKA